MDNTVCVRRIHNGSDLGPVSTCFLLQATEQIQCKSYHGVFKNLFIIYVYIIILICNMNLNIFIHPCFCRLSN